MRKSSFRLIIAALAATAALAACTKEITPPNFENDKVNPATEGSRTIAVSFAPQTKTYLEGLQPKFNDGDSVLLVTVPKARGAVQDTQTVAVSVDPTTKSATLTTTLQGDLIALYPAKLAELTKKGRYSIPAPEVQSGRFEDANICRADISAGSDAASFDNIYALLKITPPAGTLKLTIKSLPKIGTDGQRTGKVSQINSSIPGNIVTVSGQILSMPDTAYYVALTEGAGFENLSFEAEFDEDGNTGAVKGIVKEKLDIVREKDTIDGTSQVRAGWAYTIDGSNWHDYVTIGTRKWATMNIGATSPEEAGDYFVWGATVKAYSEVNTTTNLFTFVSGNPYGDIYQNDWNAEVGYDWNNTPFTNGVYSDTTMQVFTKYTAECGDYTVGGVPDHMTILDLEDDAAHVNWGGAWRMPTKEEFNSFDKFNAEWDNSSLSVKIVDSIYSVSFPAGGTGGYSESPTGLSLIGFGDGGGYLSSSVNETTPSSVHLFVVNSVSPKSVDSNGLRYQGRLVRAIVD